MKLRVPDSRLLIFLPGMITIAVLCNGVASAQKTPWIKLERGPIYELVDSAAKVTVPVPVTLLPGIDPNKVKLKLLDARIGNRYESGIAGAFTMPNNISVAPGRGPIIEIEIDPGKAAAQGAYNLLIEATTPKQAFPQLLEAQITHPAAKLQAMSTPVIEQIAGPFGKPEVSGDSLILRETSGLSRLTDIKVQPLDFTGDKSQSLTGSISFTTVPAEIERNGSGQAKYQLTGDFPLGTSKGIVMINSPQLADAIPINFEIRTRRPKWLIFFVIAFGLLLGYILRVLIQRQIQLNETRLKGIELRDSMRRELTRHADADFHAQVQAALNNLLSTLNGANAEVINTIITETEASLHQALKELEQRRISAQTSLEAVTNLTAMTWSLPEEIVRMLGEAKEGVEQVNRKIERDNIKEANDNLKSIQSFLAERLEALISLWRDRIKNDLQALSTEDILLPFAIATSLKQAIAAQANSSLPRLQPIKPNATIPQMISALETVQDVRTNVRGLLSNLSFRLQRALNDFMATLRPADLPKPEAVEELSEMVMAFKSALEEKADQPEEGLAMLAQDQLQGMNEAWRKSILAQTSGILEADEMKVKKLVDERRYADAARLIVRILEVKREQMFVRKTAAPIEVIAPTEPSAGEPMIPYPERMPVPLTRTRILRGESLPQDVELSKNYTLSQIASSKFLRFILVSIGIIAVGYLLFAEKFVGTFADLAGVFLWAFSLDVTVDAFLQAAKVTK